MLAIRFGQNTLQAQPLPESVGAVHYESDGDKSVQMVRRYIRDGSLFRENSAGKLGL